MNILYQARKNTLFFILFLLLSFTSRAQLINWKQGSDETFVFEISNQEALRLLQSNPGDGLVTKMLHTPIGSFTREWTPKPKQGHFIFANIHKNRVNYRYHLVMPFQVFLFKEYGVLTLQVVDKDGNIRKDAKVRLNKKRIYYDRVSQTYTVNDESDKVMRILTVELDGFQVFFDLEKHLVYPSWNHNNSDDRPEFYSYLITDKNKYKPGEVVRFKSYALTGNRRPLKQNLQLWMRTTNYNYKKITEIEPHRPGSFAGEVQLHDSLNLRLDQHYTIQLREQSGRIVSSTSFKYEDYELYGNKLEATLSTHNHYYPNTNQLEIKATDANGLFLPDLKTDVTIKRKRVLNSYTSVLVLPDTLFHQQLVLDSHAPTRIDIPADLFSESDCEYEVWVSTITFDNQPMKSYLQAVYYRSSYDILQTIEDGKLRFSFTDLGVEKPIQAELMYDGGKTKKVTLPHLETFNQSLSSYSIRLDNPRMSKGFSTSWIKAGLSLKGGIDNGVLNLNLENPLGIEFTWYVYEGDMMIQKGAGKDFDFKKHYPVDETKTYYAEIFYRIGKQEHVYRRTYTVQPQHLRVDLDMPERIYPGQQVTGQIKVSDYNGRPVSNVDLTAFSFNTQLGYQVPNLPYFGDNALTREQRVSYSMRDKTYSYNGPLDFDYWNRKARLSEMEYYRFTYPHGTMYKKAVNTPDSITQFAPYVMCGGNEEKIYVIELDGVPVYYSWTEQPKAYSFPVKAGHPYRITLRLHNRALVIDSFRFVPHEKLIFSVDMEHPPKEGVTQLFLGNHANSTEVQRYRSTIASFPPPATGVSAYFRKDSTDYLVYHALFNRRNRILVGPIPQGYASYNGNVTYRHQGGYYYSFEDNIVYKEPEPRTIPASFTSSLSTTFSNLNDFYLSDRVMKQRIENSKSNRYIWHPSVIHVSQSGVELRIRLSQNKNISGVSNLILQSNTSGKVLLPDEYRYGKKRFSQIPADNYNIIVLYNDGRYLKQDSVSVERGTYVEIKMDDLPLHPKDSLSEEWLMLNTHSAEIADRGYDRMNETVTQSARYNHTETNKVGEVRGYVYDESGEPLIGVSVSVKGTTIGTVTDIDGFFRVNMGGYGDVLVFSYIGYNTKEIKIADKTELRVTLQEDSQVLSEVVVVGYGVSRKSDMTGSVSSVSAAENKTVAGEEVEETAEESVREAEEKLYAELMLLNGLRKNFSDVGFWEPRLYTNRRGKAEFTVTFPDNITKWDAVVYAMNRRLMTGTARKSIRSYKPLMGELKTPQFLTVGDSSDFAGTVRNYTQDSLIRGNVNFIMGTDTLMRKEVSFEKSQNEKLSVTAVNTDSLTTQFIFTRNDGYRDGEERTIPVVPQGARLAKGSLSFLRNGDEVSFQANTGEEWNITITGQQLDIYVDATYYLMGYEYACNEQLASKLIGLLNYKICTTYNNNTFEHDDKVNEIIRRLLLNQNNQHLWSWWGRSPDVSYWMSSHIIKALKMAKEASYEVNLNTSGIENRYLYGASYRETTLSDIEMIHSISGLNNNGRLKPMADSLMKMVRRYELREDTLVRKNKNYRPYSYLREKLLLWEMQQNDSMESVRDSVLPYLKEDILGRVYCTDGKRPYSWYADNLATSLIAYRIVRQDSALAHFKEPMQLAILASRQNGWNTYQASSAVAAILPDLLAESSTKAHIAGIKVSGKENKEITQFPYQITLHHGESLSVEKVDGMPLIYNAYCVKRVTEENETKAFRITTSLAQPELVEGIPVKMVVNLQVKQEGAEYVMIEVPIPAGCSYADKASYYRYPETYREYFKEKTMIYCQRMPVGTYSFVIELLPRYTGSYILNPAKAELMYFPVINANNSLRRVDVTTRE